jgi:hypothetical protein
MDVQAMTKTECPKCGGYKNPKSNQCAGCSGYGRRRSITANGYVRLWRPGHPMANKNGFALEHRFVLHDAGIEIPHGSHVHHRNGDKLDNRLENLEVLPAGDHHRLHAVQAGVVTNQFGTFPVLTDDAERKERLRLWNAGRREYKAEWARRKKAAA